MPDPPNGSLITVYVLENPYPVGVICLALAVMMGWSGLYRGRLKWLPIAVLLGLTGLGVLVTGWLVRTAGEHSRRLTQSFVDEVVAADVRRATALLAADATLAFDSPRNPGYDLKVIKDYLEKLALEKLIDSNRVTHLRGYTKSGDIGECHLTCWTTPSSGFGPVRSQWVLWVERQDDGSWLISRITCVSINDRPASRYR